MTSDQERSNPHADLTISRTAERLATFEAFCAIMSAGDPWQAFLGQSFDRGPQASLADIVSNPYLLRSHDSKTAKDL